MDFSSRSTPVEAAPQLAPLDQPGLVLRARTYPWWETTGTFFSPQTPSGLGDDRASTRMYSWDTSWGHQRKQVPRVGLLSANDSRNPLILLVPGGSLGFPELQEK